VRLLLLDAFAVLVIVLSFVVLNEKLPDLLAGSWAMSHNLAPVLLVVGTVVLFAPFVLGIVAVSRRLGLELAAVALPRVEQGRVDNAVAPRRLLALTLQIAAVLLVGVPLVAMTQPFLPPFGAVVVLLGVLALLGTGFYRSARELQGHLQAGAELVASVLAKQSTAPQSGVDMARRLLPGIGDFTAAKVGAGSEADGQTLASLNLRGRTGATVLALLRGDQRIPFPEAGERLDAGDLVALTGSHEAISAATVLLASGKQEDH
jgi:CPA2 family monovalent cation:H+ antiporter-2